MSENKDDIKYNNSGLKAFGFCMGFAFLFFIYVVFIDHGIDMKENVRDPNAPVEATGPVFDITKVPEPWVSSPELIAYGQKFFKTNCAMCHGDEGKGDGPAGAALNPRPRNLVEGKWTQGDGEIAHFKVVQNGIPGTSMAAFGHFKAADRWAVVHYINSITNNKSKDDPAKIAEFAKTAQ